MIKKYNLALIPTHRGNEMIALAKKFAYLADGYLLGDTSLPHVTLYQFPVEEKEIDRVWAQVCKVWKKKSIELTFNQFSCITFNNNIFWASLLPNNEETLHKMHALIANTLQLPIKTTFDPHMTLMNTRNKEYETEVTKISCSYKPITDSFILSLGISDDIGQLTKIIYYCNLGSEE